MALVSGSLYSCKVVPFIVKIALIQRHGILLVEKNLMMMVEIRNETYI